MKLSRASFGRRFEAFVLDYLLFLGCFYVIAFGVVLLYLFWPAILMPIFSNVLTGFLFVTLPICLYYILLESSPRQASLGKRKRGLQVIRKDGSRLTLLRSCSRTLLKFIPFELARICAWQFVFKDMRNSPIFIAEIALVCLLVAANLLSLRKSRTHRTLYDWISNVYVVRL
jgi:uncharacterized RDD family membrane protein YckC